MLTTRWVAVMCINNDVITALRRQVSVSMYGPHKVHASARDELKKLACIDFDWIAVMTHAITQMATMTAVAGAVRT